MLAVVTTVKLLAEIALLALLGQWGIGLLFIWGGAAIAKVGICLQMGVALCK